MSDDSQDRAESFGKDMIGVEGTVTADQAEFDFPSERTHGVQFADADVTDESFAATNDLAIRNSRVTVRESSEDLMKWTGRRSRCEPFRVR
jgi:hypothetical protein